MSYNQPPLDNRIASVQMEATPPNLHVYGNEESPIATINEDIAEQLPSQQQQQQRSLRIYMAVLLAIIIALVIIDAKTTKFLELFYTSLMDWLSSHLLLGIFVVIIIYIIATILFIPGSILTIGTGYAFHQALQHITSNAIILAVLCSSVAVVIGATFGSIICFLLGRYLFRDYVQQMANHYETFRAIDQGTSQKNRISLIFLEFFLIIIIHKLEIEALQGNGFKIMILLRLSPLIPYNALDYISGITSISIGQYSLALIGIIPGTITFCYIGATASTFTEGTTSASSNNTLHTTILILGVLFALAGAAVASYYSKIELDKIMTETVDRDDFAPLDTVDDVEESPSSALHYHNHGTLSPTSFPLRPIDSTSLA